MPEGCIVASMDISITVPTDKVNINKTIDISVDPSNKNVTVSGDCKSNKTQVHFLEKLSCYCD